MSNEYPTKDQLIEIILSAFSSLDSVLGFTTQVENDVIATTPRWLRFNPNNKKGLIIKGGTFIKKSNGNLFYVLNDTTYDFTSDIDTPGVDYFVNLSDANEITVSTSKLLTGVTIGRFHTLCVNAGTLSMIAPASPSSGILVGDDYLVKPYSEQDDPDFYAFYNKEVSAVSVQTEYDVITCTHPLSGFTAGDILPESVFCLTFKPNTFVDDAMVYDKTTNLFVDIYMQSGTGAETRSAYNQNHVINRSPYNHSNDMESVGKRLLSDSEFTSIALGSNEKSHINGEVDANTVGGHSDTNSVRMISAIGCEECCGYLFQWLRSVSAPALDDVSIDWRFDYAASDGHGSFGLEYAVPHVAAAGGDYDSPASAVGSRCRVFSLRRNSIAAICGARGSCPNE